MTSEQGINSAKLNTGSKATVYGSIAEGDAFYLETLDSSVSSQPLNVDASATYSYDVYGSPGMSSDWAVVPGTGTNWYFEYTGAPVQGFHVEMKSQFYLDAVPPTIEEHVYFRMRINTVAITSKPAYCAMFDTGAVGNGCMISVEWYGDMETGDRFSIETYDATDATTFVSCRDMTLVATKL